MDLATFYETYANLNVFGVRALETPPGQTDLATAKLPALWLDSVTVLEEGNKAKAAGGAATYSGRLVLVVAPVGQKTRAARWSEAFRLADLLRAAIKEVSDPLTKWNLSVTPSLLDGYWAVVADIERRAYG